MSFESENDTRPFVVRPAMNCPGTAVSRLASSVGATDSPRKPYRAANPCFRRHWLRFWTQNLGRRMSAASGTTPTGSTRTRRPSASMLLAFVLVSSSLVAPLAGADLAIRSVEPIKDPVERYGLFELKADIAGNWENPFDPDEIDVQANFTAPSGRKLAIPGFYYRECGPGPKGRPEVTGPPEWRVRFAPQETGAYTCTLTARDRSKKEVTSAILRFTCVDGKSHGFIRVSKENPHYFAFDDGTSFFPIGMNIGWGRIDDFRKLIGRLGDAGGNFARVWVCNYGDLRLDTPFRAGREDTGVGRWDLTGGWSLDRLFQMAREKGIYIQLCIEHHHMTWEKEWPGHPLHVLQGGFLDSAEGYFTDPRALKVERDRTRYLCARYGYATQLFAWEMFNEVQFCVGYKNVADKTRAWHVEISRYLRSIDPWQHPHTTSSVASLFDLPEMDFNQSHNYHALDKAREIAEAAHQQRAQFKKPHFHGEFGPRIASTEELGKVDPDGRMLHEVLWAATMGGDAGAPAPWWWWEYVHRQELYPHFAALAAFVKEIHFIRASFEPVVGAEVDFIQRPEHPEYRDLSINPANGSWKEAPFNQPVSAKVSHDGVVDGEDRLAKVLHGLKHHEPLHNPATFELDARDPCRFHIRVVAVSPHGGAKLVVTIDGKKVLERELAEADIVKNADGTGKDVICSIDVPAGKHKLTVSNTGIDWCDVRYQLDGYVEVWKPRLRAFILAGKSLTLAWVQHTDHTAEKRAQGIEAKPIQGAELKIPGQADGTYRVEIWDTYEGKKTGEVDASAKEGLLRVPLPAIRTDVGLKIGK